MSMYKRWQRAGNHVWYCALNDEIATVIGKAFTKGADWERERTRALADLLDWLRDGIQHFTSDDDQKQREHLTRKIDEALALYRKDGGG